MNVREYRTGDLKKLNNPNLDRLLTDLKDATYMSKNGLCWTIEDEGIPVACFGGLQVFIRVLHVWIVATDQVRGRKNGLYFFRTIKRYIDEIAKGLSIKRFQTQVDASNQENCRFMRLLGFDQEYLMVNAGHDGEGDIAGFVYFPEEIKT